MTLLIAVATVYLAVRFLNEALHFVTWFMNYEHQKKQAEAFRKATEKAGEVISSVKTEISAAAAEQRTRRKLGGLGSGLEQ